MADSFFVDTNILVYFRDDSEPEKQAKAGSCLEELWRTRTGRISTQVLNEFYVTVTRKLSPGMTAEEAWDDVSLLMSWEPLPLSSALLNRARLTEESYGTSWWDSLILAAAA